MELLHARLSRFAVFEVEGESEALAMLERAFGGMYETPPNLAGFSDEGWLRSQDSPRGLGQQQDGGEYEDQTIYLSDYVSGGQILTIELFDEGLDPASPLHEDNVMLARRLEKLCSSTTGTSPSSHAS